MKQPGQQGLRRGLLVAGVVRRGSFQLQVSTSVAPGEVLVVLGPNGAGKSTLLRVVAGLVPLAEGEVSLGGRCLDGPDALNARGREGRAQLSWVDVHERRVGYVFQEYRLFPHLDVTDNVAFPLRVRGLRRRAARASVRYWLERMDLSRVATARPADLSGGQAQRVALARALAADPDVVLLDEPLAALDSRTRITVRQELRAHLSALEVPVLLVTHDPVDALTLGHRLLVIEGGQVVQEGTPAVVAARPATEYVARLVGLNLFTGRMRPDRRTVDLEGGGVLIVSGGEPVASGDVALVALNPAAITVSLERPVPGSPRNVWSGVVQAIEPLTDRIRLQVAGPPDALVDVTSAAVAELGLIEGSRVWLSAKATETVVYPHGG